MKNEVEKLVKKNVKGYKITDEQLVSLFVEYTYHCAHEKTLCKVKNNDNYWFESAAADDDYIDQINETFRREYDMLEDSCGKDEIVIYKFTPFTLYQMLEVVKEEMNIYELKHQDEHEYWNDSKYSNLRLLNDIIKQNL